MQAELTTEQNDFIEKKIVEWGVNLSEVTLDQIKSVYLIGINENGEDKFSKN